jgi:aspartate racemase
LNASPQGKAINPAPAEARAVSAGWASRTIVAVLAGSTHLRSLGKGLARKLSITIHYWRVFLKIIGLIGGMSWESTVTYYRQINETIKHRLGGLHSAKIVLYSVDFHDIERLQHAGDWEAAGAMLAEAARSLEAAGSDFLVLCTNTMHNVASPIESAVTIPLLHIADPTAGEIKRAGHLTVGLLGTRFTMEQAFYRDRLSERHGLQVIVPTEEDRDIVHRIIYEELCLGVVLPESRSEYRRIMENLASQGAEAIILGCTEISLLVSQKDSPVTLFDTTAIHARAAAEEALAQ